MSVKSYKKVLYLIAQFKIRKVFQKPKFQFNHNLTEMSYQQNNVHKPFDFLKGSDEQFNKAINSIGNMYDDMFGDDSKYDQMFETFKTENNPITESIDEMSRAIFDLDKPKEQKYIKVENTKPQNSIKICQQDDDQQSVVLGEPVYMNHAQQPLLYQNIPQPNPYYQYKK